jgi:tRNA dimethylallyltransferase
MRDKGAILIAGPTASGKSALALKLGEQLGGIIINADSMQVYRELRVLTARPEPEDEARVPHALYGFVPAAEAYSAGRFAADARRVLRKAESAGLRPIIVGGTGLYFRALLEGMSPIPSVPDDVRAHWRGEAQRLGALTLHAELGRRDPILAARLAPRDTQRIVRALEVLEATGRSLLDWQRLPGEPVLRPEDTIRLVVTIDRAELYRRCDARFDDMLSRGALEEVAALGGLALPPDRPALQALGIKPLLSYIANTMSLTDASTAAKTETRHYVKRQLTWLRRNMITWMHIPAQEIERDDVISRIFRETRD